MLMPSRAIISGTKLAGMGESPTSTTAAPLGAEAVANDAVTSDPALQTLRIPLPLPSTASVQRPAAGTGSASTAMAPRRVAMASFAWLTSTT